MTEPRRFRLLDLIGLLLVVVLAAAARGGYLWFYANGGGNDGPLAVQDASSELKLVAPDGAPLTQTEQQSLAGNIQNDGWFGSLAPFAGKEELTAHVSPGYPWLLGLLGQATPYVGFLGAPDFIVRWLHCGLGALTAGFYFLFARRAFPGYGVALLAGLFCAVHPFWVIGTATIGDGVLATFLLGGCLWLGTRGGQAGGALTSLLFGLGLAGLALVRAALLPFGFVAVLWYLLRCRRVAGGWLASLLAVLGFLTGLAPWTIRNAQQFNDLVPIVDSAYLHLYAGNNPDATGGPRSEDELWKSLPTARREQLAGKEKQLDRYLVLGEATLDEVQQQPTKTVERRLWAGLSFFFGSSWFTPEHPLARLTPPTGQTKEDREADENRKKQEAEPFRAALPAVLLGMLLLGALGWRWTYAWRQEAGLAALAVMWVPLPYLLSHAENLTGPRQPLDGVLLTFAAFAVGCLVPLRAGARLRGNLPKVEE